MEMKMMKLDDKDDEDCGDDEDENGYLVMKVI